MKEIGKFAVEAAEMVALFPTWVWLWQLKHEDHQAINDRIKAKLMALMADKPRLEAGGKWQTKQDLHKLEEFQDLNAFIYASATAVLDWLKVIHEGFEITGCWANISAPDAEHVAHTHANNYLSGVYYVQTQEGADTITFLDPRGAIRVIEPRTSQDVPQNSAKMHLHIKDGSLVMFPAWLPHMVSPNMSDKERISVSFNIMFSSFTEKMAKPMWEGNLDTR